MNKTIGLQLIVYGLLLAGLSYLVKRLAPTLAPPTLVTGMAGGALCLIWGLRALAGSRGKALAILTLIPVCFVMLSQTVMTWGGREVPSQSRVTFLLGLLFVLSVGMLMRIAYAGVVFAAPEAKSVMEATDGGRKQ